MELEVADKYPITNLKNVLNGFKEKYNEEENKLPYHINLIDELHADENAHSRILAQILRFQKKGKFYFLENFLLEVCGFTSLKIKNPEVRKVDSCGRIDIPIFDDEYVVIIENKVTDKAPDQNGSDGGQLARYIETIRNNYGRELTKIFLVYTPKTHRLPSDESWINSEKYCYKLDFKDRFISASYKDNIYPWLKKILAEVDKDDNYLSSAIEQYIDYLEGIFDLRQKNEEMNIELQKYIKKEFEIPNDNNELAFEMLSNRERELQNLVNQLQLLKSEYGTIISEKRITTYFNEPLKNDFNENNIVDCIDNDFIYKGVEFTINGENFIAVLEIKGYDNPNSMSIYFGVRCPFKGDETTETPKKPETPELLNKILNENNLTNTENFWYGWKETNMESAYYELKNFINEVIKVDKNALLALRCSA